MELLRRKLTKRQLQGCYTIFRERVSDKKKKKPRLCCLCVHRSLGLTK